MTRLRRALAATVPATLAAWVLVGCGAGVLPQVHSEPERFATARRLSERGHYAEAIELLKTYVANNGGSADVDAALYLLGECYLRSKEFASAALEFERLVRDYPESDSSGSASFRLGEAFWGQSRGPDFDQEYTLKALGQWQSYLRGYPGHWLNAQARGRVFTARTRLATKLVNTGNLYLKLRLIKPARVYFQLVVNEYADTPRIADALLGTAMCDARQGRRAEAIEQLRKVEAQYPGQAAAVRAARERQRLERGRDQRVRSERAEDPGARPERS